MNDEKIKVTNPDSVEIEDKYYRIGANIIVFVGILLIAIGFFSVPGPSDLTKHLPLIKDSIQVQQKTSDTTTKVDEIKNYWSINGTKGDFVAGIGGTFFVLAGFIYLYLSFKKQRDANELQLAAFNHDKIETRFFELLKFHRENVNELSLSYETRHLVSSKEGLKFAGEKKSNMVTHRQVFQVIVEQFNEAYNELGNYIENISLDKLYITAYLVQLQKNETLNKRNIDLIKYAKIDIIYLIVFFGVSGDGKDTIKNLTSKKYNAVFISEFLQFAALKPNVDSDYWERWAKIREMKNAEEIFIRLLKMRDDPTIQWGEIKPQWFITEKTVSPFEPFYPDNYVKYYGGHQFRLGHYFRHIYQCATFINEEEQLEPNEQKAYLRYLRGQLSTAEQILFFFNSLSQLGRIWELEDKKTGLAVPRKSQMVTDYGLIKNIPNNHILCDIRLSDFYPRINYEGFNVPDDKAEIQAGSVNG